MKVHLYVSLSINCFNSDKLQAIKQTKKQPNDFIYLNSIAILKQSIKAYSSLDCDMKTLYKCIFLFWLWYENKV